MSDLEQEVDPADSDDEALLDPEIQLLIQESCLAQHQNNRSSENGNVVEEYANLIDAIKKCDLAALQELCENVETFSLVDSRGWFPLHWAAVQPDPEVLEMVLYGSCRLTLEESTLEGETFLTSAVKAGLVDNVKMLLKHGAAPHTTNSRNESPLLLAVRIGSRRMVSALINEGARVGQVCLKKWTAVHEAAMTGHAHIMELLLSSGGKVTETDQHGVTPLGVAAEFSNAEVLEVLINNGADVNAQAPNGDSVLYDATGGGNTDCIKLLLKNGANPNIHNLSLQLPIHRAAYEGHYLALRILIPITTRRALRMSGQSPVHSAADGGHTHCLELLLQNDFNINALLAPHVSEVYGDMRKSALYFAVSNNDQTCTEMLLNSGAEPDLDPLSCLLVAVRSGRREMVKLLLAAKANVNCYFTAVTDTVFPTAMLYCIKDAAMMRLLLNHGLDARKCFGCSHDNEDDDDEYSSSEEEEKATFCEFISLSWQAHLAGRVISTLLEYVGQVSLCNKLSNILKTQAEWPMIKEAISNPRPLSHLCRVVIRKHLPYHSVPSLKAPNRIKDYLLFKENDACETVTCREK